MRWVLRLALATVVVLGLVGCGERQSTPDGSPRDAVLGFLDDVQSGRVQEGCAVLDPRAAKELRVNLLSELRVPAGSRAQRLRFTEQTTATTKSCAGTLTLLREQQAEELPRLEAAVSSAEVSRPFPTDAWTVGDEDWWVEARDGRWAITAANALAGGDATR